MRRSRAQPAEPEEVFESDGPTMGQDYERIQRHFYAIDPWEEYEHLRENLRLAERASRADYGTLVEALDEAQENAWRAHRLYCHGAVTLEAFEAQALVREGAMREEAGREIASLKEKGEWPAKLSDADLKAFMATRHPEEVRDIAVRRARAKRMVDNFEILARRWADRSRDLDTMVKTSRRAN